MASGLLTLSKRYVKEQASAAKIRKFLASLYPTFNCAHLLITIYMSNRGLDCFSPDPWFYPQIVGLSIQAYESDKEKIIIFTHKYY